MVPPRPRPSRPHKPLSPQTMAEPADQQQSTPQEPASDPQPERLQKLLSQWGVASRRQAEVLIQAGRVRVNGAIAQLGQRADPTLDRVECDGQIISPQNRPDYQYFLANKPLGLVSTCTDPEGRPTVMDLLPPEVRTGMGIHPVGRLDTYSTGALILTNDGDLTFHLTHPSHPVPKTYRVWVEGNPTPRAIQQWQRGEIHLDGTPTLPAQVRFCDRQGDRTELEVVLWEGRNRQIRRVAELLGYPVVKLHRVAIGFVQVAGVLPGSVRNLTKDEVDSLRSDNLLSPPSLHEETSTPFN